MGAAEVTSTVAAEPSIGELRVERHGLQGFKAEGGQRLLAEPGRVHDDFVTADGQMLDVIDAVGVGGGGGGDVGVEIVGGDGCASDGGAAGVGDGSGHAAGDDLGAGERRECQNHGEKREFQ